MKKIQIINGPNLNLLGKREPTVYGNASFEDYLIKAVTTPVVEVHISNVHARESFRHVSMISAACRGVILGFGLDSYRLAIESFM